MVRQVFQRRRWFLPSMPTRAILSMAAGRARGAKWRDLGSGVLRLAQRCFRVAIRRGHAVSGLPRPPEATDRPHAGRGLGTVSGTR
jgi:hypothetical protein